MSTPSESKSTQFSQSAEDTPVTDSKRQDDTHPVKAKWGPAVVSTNLQFVEPEYGDAKDQLLACNILIESTLFLTMAPKAWFQSFSTGLRMIRIMQQADDKAHDTNAQLLAERVYHKYLKWGSQRFSADPKQGSCFYTGEPCCDSRDRKVSYDPVFIAKLFEVAGPLACKIMTELHIGLPSARRFVDFIKLDFHEDDITRLELLSKELQKEKTQEDELPDLVDEEPEDEPQEPEEDLQSESSNDDKGQTDGEVIRAQLDQLFDRMMHSLYPERSV